MKNLILRNKLILLYGYACWMNGNLSKNNKLTVHHINPVRDHGESEIENGALLSKKMHSLFNFIESVDIHITNELNDYFVMYKGKYPDYIIQRIEYIKYLYGDLVYVYEDEKLQRIRSK